MSQPDDNWGRWGPDDERGAANLLTPEVIVAAASAVRQGRVIPLALPIRGATSNTSAQRVPHLWGRPLPQHFMSVDGGDYSAGARQMEGGIAVADDALIISPHGTTTHIDALAHMWRDNLLYNNHPAERVRSYGALRCGIEKLGGIVTRAVLFDIPGHLGIAYLEPEATIGAKLLQECAEQSGATLRSGDVAIVRTGWPVAWKEHPEAYGSAQPGLSYEGAEWLVGHDIVAIGADNAAVGPMVPGVTSAEGPDRDVHMLTLWRHGVYLLELMWLEELAAAGRSEFLFVVAPLAVEGGTASPITPLAVL